MTVRVGIFSFAHMHANSYAEQLRANPRGELVGIADSDSERAKQCAARYETRCFDSYEQLLDQKLDAAVVASENANHRRIVEICVDAGVKYIICEKPIATTDSDGRAMVELCRSRKVQLYTAFPCRFSPVAQRLHKQVASGALGEILAIRGTNRGLMPGGWFTEKALSGGGAVIDHTVHVADCNRWMLRKEAVEVYAEIGNGFYHKDFDDTGMLTVTYDGGTFATIDTSWSRPENFPRGDLTLQVIGTAGVAEADLFTQYVSVYSKDSRVSIDWWGSNLDRWMVDGFLRAAQGEDVPEIASGEDGLRALEVALAAYRSAEQGAPVTLASLAARA